MSAQGSIQPNVDRKATSEDVRRVLGDLEDTVVVEVLSHEPSFRELSDAALWIRGDGDLIARERIELSAAAMAVAEILARENEEQVDETP
jgi:hypothetical protein